MYMVQAIALYLGAGIWAVLVPPLLVAVPCVVSTYRYQRTVQIKPRPRMALMTLALFIAFAACLFVFAPAQPSLRFQIGRAIVMDVTILLVACVPAVLLYHRRYRLE